MLLRERSRSSVDAAVSPAFGDGSSAHGTGLESGNWTGGPSGPGTARDLGSLRLSDTYLLTSDDSGPVAVPGVGVLVDAAGVTVLKPGGAIGAVLPWASLRGLATPEPATTPDGAPAVVVEATSAERSHRFLVPTDDADGLGAAVSELMTRYTVKAKPKSFLGIQLRKAPKAAKPPKATRQPKATVTVAVAGPAFVTPAPPPTAIEAQVTAPTEIAMVVTQPKRKSFRARPTALIATLAIDVVAAEVELLQRSVTHSLQR